MRAPSKQYYDLVLQSKYVEIAGSGRTTTEINLNGYTSPAFSGGCLFDFYTFHLHQSLTNALDSARQFEKHRQFFFDGADVPGQID